MAGALPPPVKRLEYLSPAHRLGSSLPTFDASPAISQDPESKRLVLSQTLRTDISRFRLGEHFQGAGFKANNHGEN